MKINQILEYKDMCTVCGQTPCNCTHLTEGEQLFYARNPDGTRTYARINDPQQLAQLRQRYSDSEVKTMSFNRPDVADWLTARGVNLRGFLPGMVVTRGLTEDEIYEFAPPGDDGSGDGFSDETLKRLAAQWYNGDEDPRVEKTLAAAGWEIGQDEGYDDEPGVFVVQAGDVNGNSYMSWPADELKGLAEDMSRRGFLQGLGMAAAGAAGLGAAGAAQAGGATVEWRAKVERAKALMAKGQSREQTARIMGIKGPNPGGAGPMSGDWGAVNYAANEMRVKEGVAEGAKIGRAHV